MQFVPQCLRTISLRNAQVWASSWIQSIQFLVKCYVAQRMFHNNSYYHRSYVPPKVDAVNLKCVLLWNNMKAYSRAQLSTLQRTFSLIWISCREDMYLNTVLRMQLSDLFCLICCVALPWSSQQPLKHQSLVKWSWFQSLTLKIH